LMFPDPGLIRLHGAEGRFFLHDVWVLSASSYTL
jgi:hypothetical protein